MQSTTLLLLLASVSFLAYFAGRERALAIAGGLGRRKRLHSLPDYYGYFLALSCLLPALLVVSLWTVLESRVLIWLLASELAPEFGQLGEGEVELLVNNVRNLAYGDLVAGTRTPLLEEAAIRYTELRSTSRWFESIAAIAASGLFALLAWRRIRLDFRARNSVESVVVVFLIAASSIALLTTVGIVLSVLFEAMRFFQQVSLIDFLFGTEWSPQTAIRADQVGSSGSFGVIPLLTGTLLITGIATLVAVPIGLFGAIYMTEYASRRFRSVAKPLLELLAGIPTVVYGFFAALTVAPMVQSAGTALGLDVASESALAAGLVMGIMIIPLVSSLSDDAIRAVPKSLREAALALGSTRGEMITGVVLPAALPGVAGGVLLAVSRAIGETMIVVMAAGLAANLTANPFEAVTTVTVQIVTLLVGDQEFNSAKTLAAFALGLVLFLMTMLLNVVGLRFVRRYREQYE